MRWYGKLLGGAAAAFVLTACAEDGAQTGAEDVLGPSAPAFNVVPTGYIDVYKFGPEGTYAFEATTPAGTSTFSLAAGSRTTVWTMKDPTAPLATVTVTELLEPGMQVDSIVVVVYTDAVQTSKQLLVGTNTATVTDLNNLTDVAFKFYNSMTPRGGTQGCTPGYWQQPHHFDSWVGYAPSDSFDAVFGVNYGGTLLGGLNAKGGGVHALARHAVAALLSSSTNRVDYAASPSQVIAAVQAAFAAGDFKTMKNQFERWNEMGCPLN